MDIEIFVFSVEAFLFSEFYKNEAKHDKCIFKRGLNIASIQGQKCVKLLEKSA